MEKQREKLSLPALSYLVCTKGLLPYIQTDQSSQKPCIVGECSRSDNNSALICYGAQRIPLVTIQ